MGRWIVAICSVFLKLLLTAKKQVNREWAWSISTIWLRAASIISSLFHSLHYLKFHNGEASPFSLQRLNERWRWMEAQNAANRNEQARTSPQTAVGETYTGSSTQFSSSVFSHAPHPFDVRENPFQKRQQGYVFTELRLVCVCVVMAVYASSVPAHIIYQQRLQCVCTSVCLCQRGFPFASVAQSHTGRGREGWQSTRDCTGMAQAHLH